MARKASRSSRGSSKGPKKGRFYEGCARAVARKPRGRFAAMCKKRYPDLAGGVPMDAVPESPFKKTPPKECREVLSREMKKGNRKGAMKKYWECRRARG